MNFFDPIPNADFQIGITLALLCVMFIFLYAGVKIINRIEELRSDMLQEDKQVEKSLDSHRAYASNMITSILYSIEILEHQINRPLYEIGNTIWYNDGATGKPGVFEDIKGKIIAVQSDGKSEPLYLIKVSTKSEVLIPQSLINAWTN
jgi:hypothetical protein